MFMRLLLSWGNKGDGAGVCEKATKPSHGDFFFSSICLVAADFPLVFGVWIKLILTVLAIFFVAFV